MKRLWTGTCLSLLFLTLAPEGPAAAPSKGLPKESASDPKGTVVEKVEAGFAAHQAGLQAGDILLTWQRAASPPNHSKPAEGTIESPFDLLEIEIEQAPLGEFTLSGTRSGERLRVRLPLGEWRLESRPRWIGSVLETYKEAAALIAKDDIERGVALWEEMASDFEESRDHLTASWLHLEIANTDIWSRDPERGRAAFEAAQRQAAASGEAAALALAKDSLGKSQQNRSRLEQAAATFQEVLDIRRASSPNSLGIAQTLVSLGKIASLRGELDAAEDFFRRSLNHQETITPQSLGSATSLMNLGNIAFYRGNLAAAEDFFRHSLSLQEKLAPGSINQAKSLNNLGTLIWRRGNLAAAEDLFRRSLAIKKKLVPQSLDVAGGFNNLGLVAFDRGNLALAEEYHRRSLALWQELSPNSLGVANSYSNLGNTAWYHGELAAAEDYHKQSLAIREKLAPQSLPVAATLENLGSVAFDRDDLVTAEDFFRRALKLKEKLAPQSLAVAAGLTSLGMVALARKELGSAEKHLRQAVVIAEDLAPRSLETSVALQLLGDVARTRGDLDIAETHYQRSLAIGRERAPRSSFEADSCQRLATVHRRRGELDQALGFYDCAVEALEAQKGKLSGSDEARSGFGARYASTYREAIDLLVEVGQESGKPFTCSSVTEPVSFSLFCRSVTSSSCPTCRKTSKTSGILPTEATIRPSTPGCGCRSEPPPSSAGQRVKSSIRRGASKTRSEPRSTRHRRVSRISKTRSPWIWARRARPWMPELCCSPTRSAPKGVCSSLSGRGKASCASFALAIGEVTLRADVERLRGVLARGRFDRRPEKALLVARQLSEQLLAPVSTQIASADRLLILADGPLHSMPFAALADPGTMSGQRFLIETKPLFLAASATVFDLLKQERTARRATRLAAFGDPHYPAGRISSIDTSIPLRTALRTGLDLSPLPATRTEVESLGGLFPQTSRIFLGAEATEGRVKALGAETTHLHIASHGLLDDRFPLESALAFSIPSRIREDEDNGLLQAWEIFEQIRIDADLVTLSACDTGRGKVLGGEGLMGLTRAFQYAGARTVVASLWSVGDASTGELMQLFYGYLKEGQSKADALRSAQLDLLRDSSFSHPFHWAGFQLVGDWR